MTIRLFCLSLALLFVPVLNAAESDVGDYLRWEVALLAGISDNSSALESTEVDTSSVDVDSGSNYALIVNHFDRPYEQGYTQYEYYLAVSDAEIEVEQIASGSKQTIDLQSRYLHVGGTYVLANSRYRSITPYVGATLGLAQFDADGFSTENEFSMGLSGGFKLPVTNSLGFRLDARAIAVFLDTDTKFFCSGGCIVELDSDIWWQYHVNAGLIWRF